MKQQHQQRAATRTEEHDGAALLEEILADVQAAGKDTTALSREDRSALLVGLARKLGLNPLSGAVTFLKTQGREVLYVTKAGTDQIAARERLSRRTVRGPEVVTIEGRKVCLCAVEATHPDGRSEVSTATIPLADPANDLMKVETKAKRRATLSVCGLGLLSEDEVDQIPGARPVVEAQPTDVSRAESHDRVSAWWENEVSSCSTKRDIVETWCGAESGIAGQPWDVREAMWQMLVERATALGFWRDAPSVAAALKADIEEHKRHDEERAAIQAEGSSHYERAWALIQAARSLDVLAAAWRIVVREAWPHLDAFERAGITAAKDQRKKELSPPPTGTDGPSVPSGDEPEPTPAAEEWTATVDGQRAHVSAKSDIHELRASALKHGPTLGNGYVALCAQRVVALTGGEHTLESAERWCRTPIVRARKVVAA